MTSMQDTKTLLTAAKGLMASLARDRAEIASIVANRASDEPWIVEIFDTAQTRIANIEADIAHARGRLEAIREDLIGRGLTQDECKAIWRTMQA